MLLSLIVEEQSAEQRIDNYLLAKCKKLPKAYFYQRLRKGLIRVNGKKVLPTYRVQPGDRVTLPELKEGSAIKLKDKRAGYWSDHWILHEEASFLVINKPSGLAVHGGSGTATGLIERLRASRPEAAMLELVHRLDKGTSGLLLVAKKRSALKALQAQLFEKEVLKHYLALVAGRWPTDLASVALPLKKVSKLGTPRIVKVRSDGKPAKTMFQVLKRFEQGATLLQVSPITGRTHQIRVHTAESGFPIIGDDRYGAQTKLGFLNLAKHRLYLHAHELKFQHPITGDRMQFKAPPPAHWNALL